MAQIVGRIGPETLVGTAGADLIDGLGGGDLIEAGGGDDTVTLHGGDTVRGGDGNDRFVVPEDAAGTGLLFAGAGADVFVFPEGGGQDGRLGTLFTFAVGDFDAGVDRIDLRAFAQGFYLYGMIQSGEDVLILAKEGGRYESDWQPIFRLEGVTLADLDASNFIGERPLDLSGIILGFERDDTLLGTDAPDAIDGQAGSDVVLGYGGNDTISGGSGSDTLRGGLGNDSIDTGDGADLAEGGPGNDTIVGELSPFHGSGDDTLIGGDGNDVLYGVTDRELLLGGAGNDILGVSNATGKADGGVGDDTFSGVGSGQYYDSPSVYGSWLIRTGSGRDVLQIDAGGDGTFADTVTDFLAGAGGDRVDVSGFVPGGGDPFAAGALNLVGSGDDSLLQNQYGATLVRFLGVLPSEFTAENFFGFAPQSPPVGTPFDDSLIGRGGPDFLAGYGGNDTLSGQDNDDTLQGGPGDDLLFGGAGDDRLGGGDGNDTLSGGGGNDYLVGNLGADSMSGGGASDALLGAGGNDTIQGDGGDDFVGGGSGDDVVSGGEGFDTLAGGDGNDRIEGGIGRDLLRGNAGNDTIIGGTGADTLVGGEGADLFVMGAAQPGLDLLVDFHVGEDRLDLTEAGLAGEAAVLGATRYVAGGALIVTSSGALLLAGVHAGDLVGDFAV